MGYSIVALKTCTLTNKYYKPVVAPVPPIQNEPKGLTMLVFGDNQHNNDEDEYKRTSGTFYVDTLAHVTLED